MRHITPPEIKVTQTQLECVKCGARSHATCSCGVNYRPVMERVREYDEANPGKSTRAAAADLGVHHSTVAEARSGVGHPTGETVTGRDGKQYPSSKPPSPPQPGAILKRLGHEIIDVGFKAMAERFQDDKPTIGRLEQARDDLRGHWNNVEYF